jgi:hypothetical protein
MMNWANKAFRVCAIRTSTVLTTFILLASCADSAQAPVTEESAAEWYLETKQSQDCLFPDLNQEPCQVKALIKIQRVLLEPGQPVYFSTGAGLKSRYMPVPTNEQTELWCFLERRFKRDAFVEGEVFYEYPCYELPEPMELSLRGPRGWLQEDGIVGPPLLQECQIDDLSEENLAFFLQCKERKTLRNEPSW